MTVIESTERFAPAGTWRADPVHSSVSFEVGYAGVNAFRGSFREFNATLSGDSLEGSAKVASVDVKDEQLNGHLQTPDFFDAQRYPEITFRATELVRHGDDTVTGKGDLTIKGNTRPITLQGTIAPAPANDPFGRERLGIRLAADAILFATPEYNGSVPGGLKNAVDWASRPEFEAALTNKTVAVIGASIGQFGAMWAQADLRKILGVAGARVVGDELPVTRAHERFDGHGRLLDEELRGRLALALETVAREAAPLAAPVAAW